MRELCRTSVPCPLPATTEKLVRQLRNACHRWRSRNLPQKRIDVLHFLVCQYLGSIGRHIPSGLADVMGEICKRSRIRRKPDPGAAALAFVTMALVAAICGVYLLAIDRISGR